MSLSTTSIIDHVRIAALVAASKTSSTPSPVNAEHSKYCRAPHCSASSEPWPALTNSKLVVFISSPANLPNSLATNEAPRPSKMYFENYPYRTLDQTCSAPPAGFGTKATHSVGAPLLLRRKQQCDLDFAGDNLWSGISARRHPLTQLQGLFALSCLLVVKSVPDRVTNFTAVTAIMLRKSHLPSDS